MQDAQQSASMQKNFTRSVGGEQAFVRVPNGHRALVLGCGASGAAAARFLHRRGWQVSVADTRETPPAAAALKSEGIAFAGGGLSADMVSEDLDLLVMSPGLSPEHSAAAPLVARAKSLHIDIAGEIELFARELKRLAAFRHYRPLIIAITGTNGKTTTTTIVGKMAAACGKSVCVAGNIGPNAVAELDRLLTVNELPETWVLELSSFQLETTVSLTCDAAAFLNLTEDHVDWHGSMEAYAAAKGRIFSASTKRVLNADDPVVMQCAEGVDPALVEVFSDADPKEGPFENWGIAKDAGLEWLAYMPRTPAAATKIERLAAEPVEKTLLMPVDALLIRGRHNAMNALAALALVKSAGLPLGPALEALKSYKGEPHRVQPVLAIEGIEFIDDSKGTNVGATIAALEGLGKSGKKSSIILGGDGKGQNFAPLAESLARWAVHAVLIGRDAPKIREALEAAHVAYEEAGVDFEAAVNAAWRAAREAKSAGDDVVVLLSPACASWDMFSNYAERSARFVARAQKIAGDVAQSADGNKARAEGAVEKSAETTEPEPEANDAGAQPPQGAS